MGGLTAATAADVPESHHKDADAATHSAGQSALRSPHLREPLRSIHQHRLLPWDSRSPAPPLCWNTGPARPGVLPSSCTDSSWAPPALEPHHYNGRPNEAPRCLPQLARARHRSGHYMDGRRKPHANACPGLAHGKPLATQPPGTTPSTACCLKIEGACRILSLLGPGPLDRESAPHGVRLRPVIAGSTKLDVLPRRDAQPSTGHLPCAPLRLDSVYQRAACELEPGPRQPLLRPYHGGRRLGWKPLGRGTSWHCPTGWLRRSAPSVVSPLRSPGPAWAALRSPLRPASPSPLCGCRAATHRGWQSAAALLPGPPLRISHYYRRLIILLQAWLIALPLPTHGVEHRPGAAGCARSDISSSTPHPPTSTSTPEG